MDGRRGLTMVTPIDAVRFHYTFSDAEYWPFTEDRSRLSSERDPDNHLAPARGAMLGVALGGLMWAGLIIGFRAILGV